MLHWAQDFARISKVPIIIGLTESEFLVKINTAGERADVRKLLREQSDAKAKVSSPGPLVSELKWPDWEPQFTNYLSTIAGMNGIPLSYVIRENDSPNRTGLYANFTEE